MLFSLFNYFQKNQSCILCDDVQDEPICPACLDDLRTLYTRRENVCPKCIAPSEGGQICERCQRNPLPFAANWASVQFAPPLPSVLTQWKHQQNQSLQKLVAQTMCENPPFWLHKARIDWILPMPISRERRIERGFNQSEELAEILGETFDLPVLSRDAIFRHHKNAQSTLNRAQRFQNIQGAFEPMTDVRDQRILLIDDVFTTGATLTELSRSLHEAGAEKIFVWVWARTLVHDKK